MTHSRWAGLNVGGIFRRKQLGACLRIAPPSARPLTPALSPRGEGSINRRVRVVDVYRMRLRFEFTDTLLKTWARVNLAPLRCRRHKTIELMDRLPDKASSPGRA